MSNSGVMLTGCHSNSWPASGWCQIIRHRSDAPPPCRRRSRRPEMTSATTVTWPPSLSTVQQRVHSDIVPSARVTTALNSRSR